MHLLLVCKERGQNVAMETRIGGTDNISILTRENALLVLGVLCLASASQFWPGTPPCQVPSCSASTSAPIGSPKTPGNSS